MYPQQQMASMPSQQKPTIQKVDRNSFIRLKSLFFFSYLMIILN
jgi:hypothetical protein